MHYFSDGSAGQYKNCKNFMSFCLHNSDFGVKCEWKVFATSDSIGGTVKRLVMRASLKRPISNQILIADKIFGFCIEEIKGIDFVLLKNQDTGNTRVNAEERCKRVDTVPGTRSFHQSIPISDSVIGAKYISDDQYYAVQFDFNIVHLLGPGIPFLLLSLFYVFMIDNIGLEL